MKITPVKYAKSLAEALDGAPKEMADSFLDNFLNIVEKNNDGKNLPDILAELKKIEQEKSGIKKISVITAVSLSEKSAEEILKKLEKIFSSKIEIKYKVNPAILGGIVIEKGDEIFDKSLLSHINKFKHLIIN